VKQKREHERGEQEPCDGTEARFDTEQVEELASLSDEHGGEGRSPNGNEKVRDEGLPDDSDGIEVGSSQNEEESGGDEEGGGVHHRG
jgi:hypothetical protein